MSAHAVSLAQADRLESFVVPFIPSTRAGSEFATLPLADVGPTDMVYEGIVGRSRALRDLVDQIKLVAPTESTVLKVAFQCGMVAQPVLPDDVRVLAAIDHQILRTEDVIEPTTHPIRSSTQDPTELLPSVAAQLAICVE